MYGNAQYIIPSVCRYRKCSVFFRLEPYVVQRDTRHLVLCSDKQLFATGPYNEFSFLLDIQMLPNLQHHNIMATHTYDHNTIGEPHNWLMWCAHKLMLCLMSFYYSVLCTVLHLGT